MSEDSLFVTKVLVPRRRSHAIRRGRLLERILAEESPVVVLRAPAGYGKTTLLVDLAQEAPGEACWISLDQWDQDPWTFLRYLRLSIERGAQPSTSRRHQRPLAREPRVQLADLTSHVSRRPDKTWVLLDDFHHLEGASEILFLIDYWLQRLPDNCRVLIASRTPPPIRSLARLRLEGKAQEIGPVDLAFTAEELRKYYGQVLGRELSQAQVERILGATQGWPAAVALLDTLDRPAEKRPALRLSMSEYLAAEVLGRLPDELRRFLLWTSIFETLDASACDAVLDHKTSAHLLESLEAQNVPVMRVVGPTITYKLHPLLRDFLQEKLGTESPDLRRELNRKAGAWQAARGRTSEAIWHFKEAEDWDSVERRVVEEAPTAYKLGRWHTITSWLQGVPTQELRNRPRLRLWEARILARLAQVDEALQVVSQALAAIGEAIVPLVAEFETTRATALRIKGDVERALSSSRQAVDLAIRSNAPVDVLAESKKQLGLVLFIMGAFSEAEKEFRSVLEIYEQGGNLEEAAFANGCLGSALGSRGRLVESAAFLEQARQQWRRAGNIKELSWVLNNLAMTYYQMGQVDLARELFLDSLTKARRSGHHRAEAYALVSLADIDRESGELPSALERYVEAMSLSEDLRDMTLSSYALTGLAHTHRQMGDLGKGEALARQALVSARQRESAYDEGQAQIALGRVWRERGDLEAARDAFSAAADLFDQVKAGKELAMALFYVAESCLSQRRSRPALRATLERVAYIAAELSNNYFLVRASAELPAVAEYGASRRIAGGFYRELLRRSVAPDSRRKERLAETHATGRAFPVVDVSALGDLAVALDGRKITDVEWESEKSKELLLFLLTEGRRVPKDEIVVALWPDAPRARANSAFHSTVYRVRRALYPECVIQSSGAYVVNAATFCFDVCEFEALVDSTREMGADDPAYAEALHQAVGLYRGPFAPTLESEWADTRRLKLEQAFLEVAAKLADRFLAQGSLGEAVMVCERVLENDPYNEAACYKLLRAHVAGGNYEAALHAYRRYRELLEMDLGEAPGTGLQKLYSEIRGRLGAAVDRPP